MYKDQTIISAKMIKYLDYNELKQILKYSKVQFVIKTELNKYEWVEYNECYQFWKNEVKDHIPESYQNINYARFYGDYCYIASLWINKYEFPIVLLEYCH